MWFILILLFHFQGSAVESVGLSIEQAQTLALKKNRVEATTVLRRALSEQAGNPKARARLAESLQQISKMFFTDKGQKAFESGQVAMWDTPDLSLVQFREALALEDQNVLVLNNVARIQLIKQDCDGAIQTLQQSRQINSLDGETAVLQLRAHLCKSDYERLREKAKDLPALGKWEEGFVSYLLAQELIQQKNFRKAADALSKFREEHPGFPEVHWSLAKIAPEVGKDSELFLQKYVSLCKAITARDRKRYALEPRLCANLKEAEDELAKTKSSDI